jgi:cellulose synthase/poly-beta-1,6-N-acetylglucosamine synthase-like glycosyltransferase
MQFMEFEVMNFRFFMLFQLGRLYSFEPSGDLQDFSPCEEKVKISCVINFFGRLDLLAGILHSLAQQDFPVEEFEVVLVEDQGGTPEARQFCESFQGPLNIVYQPLDKNYGRMGYSRNFGLSFCRGEFVLFLDDDTVILQQDFLSALVAEFEANPDSEAIVPHGSASYALVEDRYDYHHPYFMTSRCMAYRRSVLEELGGFVSDFVGQEDVEFVVRFILAGKRSVHSTCLAYHHPPLLVPNYRKPMAVGASFFKLKKRYPLFLWLLVLLNCCRHAPLVLLPSRKMKESGRFGLGFLLGIWQGVRKNHELTYG